MNILLLCDEYPPGRHGGIGTSVQLLARELVRQGHRAVVAGLYDWGYGGQDHFEDEGVQVYRFRYSLAGRWLQGRDKLRVRLSYRALRMTGLLQADITRSLKHYGHRLEALIKRYETDIVEMPDFQEYMPYTRRYTAFPRLSAPVVVKLHGSLTHIWYETSRALAPHIQASEAHILKSAAAVSSVSRFTAIQAAARFDYHRPIEVLYNGLSLDAIPQPAAEKAPLVIFTGALVALKGIQQLLRAWNKVHESMPAARLQIYGKGPAGELRGLLTQEAGTTVSFMGHVPRAILIQDLGRATAAVFPSYTESFALAPMEAMACGTAVIFTTRASGPELIEDGVNGLLADPTDIDGIARQIIFLLQNPDVAARLAAAARHTIATRFSIQEIAARNIAFYERVVANLPKAGDDLPLAGF